MPLGADGIRLIATFKMRWQRRGRCAIAVFSTPRSLLFTFRPLCLYCLALSLGFTRLPILYFLAARIRVGPSAPILLSTPFSFFDRAPSFRFSSLPLLWRQPGTPQCVDDVPTVKLDFPRDLRFFEVAMPIFLPIDVLARANNLQHFVTAPFFLTLKRRHAYVEQRKNEIVAAQGLLAIEE